MIVFVASTGMSTMRKAAAAPEAATVFKATGMSTSCSSARMPAAGGAAGTQGTTRGYRAGQGRQAWLQRCFACTGARKML